jgi:hypothetical protein
MDRVERAEKRALRQAEEIALRVRLHPDRVEPYPGPFGRAESLEVDIHPALRLGEEQAAKFSGAGDEESWKAYHWTLAKALARLDIGYFIVDAVPQVQPDDIDPEFYLYEGPVSWISDPVAWGVDLNAWEPKGDLEMLRDPPPSILIYRPVYGDAPPRGLFKPRFPWWLRGLRRFVIGRERRRRKHWLGMTMEEWTPPPVARDDSTGPSTSDAD